jgi:hypothetical protein
MSSSDPAGPADITHPRRALARLALSHAATELADRAAALVPTVSDGYARPGEHTEQADQLAAIAREVLDRAVVFDRDRGASWADVGAALDVTRQTAHERFAPVLTEWESGLDEPWSAGPIRNSRLPEGAADPARAAARLDTWCAAHALASARNLAEQNGIADRMVSAGLPTHTETSEAASLLRQANHITERGATPEQRAAFEARKAAVLRGLDDDQVAGCSCQIHDAGGPGEYRQRDSQCRVHRPRSGR